MGAPTVTQAGGMDPSTTFYQALTSTSFTLLGLWVGVMQFAHGGWRSNPERHATTLHITLKFFLPAVLGLVSLLGSANDGGIVWRTAFVLGGSLGFLESVRYLRRDTERPVAAVRRLALADPVLYLVVVAVAFIPAGTLAITPLQAEGMATGLVFVTGLVAVWFALSERAPEEDEEGTEKPDGTQTTVLPPVTHVQSPFQSGLFTHRAVPHRPRRAPR